MTRLGVGIGWRPEIDLTVESMPGIDFVEAIADGLRPNRLPVSLELIRQRGTPILPHSIGLSLGSAERPDVRRLEHLARTAEALGAPLVSDHMAFVRSGTIESGHLLPVPLTRDALEVMVENVRIAQDCLPVPLAIENVAAVVEWPDNEMTESAFLSDLLERTAAMLLLDVENLYANWVNFGRDPIDALNRLPLERVAYVHVAGGVMSEGVWRDTHQHPVPNEVWDLLDFVASQTELAGVMLERDGRYPTTAEMTAEVDRIRISLERRHAAA